jgi:hypothetical protein
MRKVMTMIRGIMAVLYALPVSLIQQDVTLFRKVLGTLNEAQRRWVVGREALRHGRGGIQRMVEASGLSKPTVLKGIRELHGTRKLIAEEGRVRSQEEEEDESRSKRMIRRSPDCRNW